MQDPDFKSPACKKERMKEDFFKTMLQTTMYSPQKNFCFFCGWQNPDLEHFQDHYNALQAEKKTDEVKKVNQGEEEEEEEEEDVEEKREGGDENDDVDANEDLMNKLLEGQETVDEKGNFNSREPADEEDSNSEDEEEEEEEDSNKPLIESEKEKDSKSEDNSDSGVIDGEDLDLEDLEETEENTERKREDAEVSDAKSSNARSNNVNWEPYLTNFLELVKEDEKEDEKEEHSEMKKCEVRIVNLKRRAMSDHEDEIHSKKKLKLSGLEK